MFKELQEDALSSAKKGEVVDAVLPDFLKDLIEQSNIPNRDKEEIAVQIASSFKGPLPPPELLLEYDKAVDNGSERIFRWHGMQMEHRMHLENHVIKEELRDDRVSDHDICCW